MDGGVCEGLVVFFPPSLSQVVTISPRSVGFSGLSSGAINGHNKVALKRRSSATLIEGQLGAAVAAP